MERILTVTTKYQAIPQVYTMSCKGCAFEGAHCPPVDCVGLIWVAVEYNTKETLEEQ